MKTASKRIRRFPGYRVFNDGRIFNEKKGAFLKGSNHNGYLLISVRGNRSYVHRLVAEAFCRKRSRNNVFVNHKDSNKTNNHYKNLEWCTGQANTQHYWESEKGKSRIKSTEERLRPYMVRLEKKHRELIRKGAKKLGIRDAEYVRKCIEFPPVTL